MKRTLCVVLLFVFSACSLFDDDKGVVISSSAERLIIDNNNDVRIYYLEIDSVTDPYTDWAPFRDDSLSIKAKSSKKIKFDDIYTDKARSLQQGDDVTVHWWTDEFIDDNQTFLYDKVGVTNGSERITL